jgi:hypothetical protein
MRIAEDIPVSIIACTDVHIKVPHIPRAVSAVYADTSLPDGRHAIDEYSSADACAIETARCTFDDLYGLEIVKAQLIQIGIAPRVCQGYLIPVDLDISYSEGAA